jgi:hypothetical protein
MIWRRLASFPVLLGAVLVGITYAGVRPFFVDPDLWWHLKTGELILLTHRLPIADTYSYTAAGLPWISIEWLAEVFFASVFKFDGLRGLEALMAVLAALVMLSLYWFATLRSTNSTAAFLASAALLGMANGSFNLRPQMLGFLFLTVTLICLERFRQGHRKAVWFLPPLYLIWINTHGSWIVGLGTIFVYLAAGLITVDVGSLSGRKWSEVERIQLEAVLLLCLVAISITPYGTELARYPFLYSGSSLPVNFSLISEWQPMPFNILPGRVFLGILLGFLLIQFLVRFRWHTAELLLFFFGTAMACLHVRFLLLFVPFFIPLLATTIANWLPAYDRRNDQPAVNAVLIGAVIGAIVWSFPQRSFVQARVAERFPVNALEYMNHHTVPTPLFNTYDFGGYLVWSGHTVFVDGRADLFETAGVLGNYSQIAHLEPGAMKVLASYGVRSCLLGRDDRLAGLLAILPDWQNVYSDELSVLYVKRNQ